MDAIREFDRAIPLKPCEICTNGERLHVPHPDFIYVAPSGCRVMVTDENDRLRHISSILIEEIAALRNRIARKRAKKRR